MGSTLRELSSNYEEVKDRSKRVWNTLEYIRWFFYVSIDVFVLPISWLIKGILRVDEWSRGVEVKDVKVANIERVDINEKMIPSKSDLDLLVDFACEAFAISRVPRNKRRRMFERWFKINNKSFLFFTVPQKEKESYRRVGYSCVLPFKKEGYISYRRGEVSDFKFNERHVLSGKSGKYSNHICVQAFAICEDLTKEHWQILYHNLARHISLYTDNFFKDRMVIVSEGATRYGVKILEELGFVKVGISANNTPLYELDANDYHKMMELSRWTVDTLSCLNKKYGKEVRDKFREVQ